MTTQPFEVVGLDHVQLAAPAGCEDAAREFYGGLLGLPELPKPATLAGRGGVWFQVGAQGLHIGVEQPFAAARKAHPALLVRNLDALAERLETAGVPVTWDADLPGYRRFYAYDPWGNRLELLWPDDAEPRRGVPMPGAHAQRAPAWHPPGTRNQEPRTEN